MSVNFYVVQLDTLLEPVDAWENIGIRFAEFVLYAWQTDAQVFAADLAHGGASPSWLWTMARRWREFSFEPPEYAGALDAFADSVRRLLPEASA